jgi:hypothetical protein
MNLQDAGILFDSCRLGPQRPFEGVLAARMTAIQFSRASAHSCLELWRLRPRLGPWGSWGMELGFEISDRNYRFDPRVAGRWPMTKRQATWLTLIAGVMCILFGFFLYGRHLDFKSIGAPTNIFLYMAWTSWLAGIISFLNCILIRRGIITRGIRD